MSEAKHITISLNTGALLANYLGDIQNLSDIVLFIYAGHELVTEKNYDMPIGFVNIQTASNRKLSFQQAKEQSDQWMLTSFLSESVNTTGSFLDEVRRVCALYRIGAKRRIKARELNDILGNEATRFHRLGFPEKFTALANDFGVKTELDSHFLSLNRARNCLVHRRGIVSERDTNEDGRLVIKWRVAEMVAKPIDGTPEVVLLGPRVLESETQVYMRVVDRTKAFGVGQRISLVREELCQNMFTLLSLAKDLVGSVEGYGRTMSVLPTQEAVDKITPTTQEVGNRPTDET